LRYFELSEFECPCCKQAKMDQIFLNMLDHAREFAQVPFIINSGYRCDQHNREVGSTSNNHTSGRAADIACKDGPTRLRIVSALLKAGFKRLGIAKTFIHVDSNDGSPESIWLY
jgi:zinc D-Ala-D-Ala carboxypeptidase